MPRSPQVVHLVLRPRARHTQLFARLSERTEKEPRAHAEVPCPLDAPRSPPLLKPGDQIEGYRVRSMVGAGGMGAVYLALPPSGRPRPVAIKILLPQLRNSSRARRRFQREAAIQSSLMHPNIVRVEHVIESPEHLGMVLELVDGPSLEHVLEHERQRAWSPDESMEVMAAVVDAMAFAHDRRVVHRDLKPGNVLLERRDTPADFIGVPKVTDFGIARAAAEGPRMTREGSVMGTPPFMSPEQYRGELDVGASADVFALGMMFWQLLTGALPADPANPSELHEFYSGARPLPSIGAMVPGLPAGLVTSIDAALCIDPVARPRNARRFMEVITGVSTPAAASATGPVAAQSVGLAEWGDGLTTGAPAEPTGTAATVPEETGQNLKPTVADETPFDLSALKTYDEKTAIGIAAVVVAIGVILATVAGGC